MNKPALYFLTCGSFAIAFCSQCFADLLPPSRESGTTVCVLLNQFLPSELCPADKSTFQDVNGSGTAHSIGTFQAGSGVFSGSATARSFYGSMGASASGTLTAPGSPVAVSSEAIADFTEVLTVSVGGFNDRPGLLQLGYTLDANVNHSGSINAAVLVEGFVGVPNSLGVFPQSQFATYINSVSGLFAFPGLFQFTYGQPFDLLLAMFADVGTFNLPLGNDSHDTSLAGTGNVDALNTLILSGLHVFDMDGNDLSNEAVFTSGSGAVYTANGVVPEPSSILLLVGALGIVLRRHHSSKW